MSGTGMPARKQLSCSHPNSEQPMINSTPDAPHGRRTRLMALVGLKLAVSGALTWWVFSSVDMGASAERAASIDPAWAVAALLMFLILLVLGALRWLVFTRALAVPSSATAIVRINFVASFLGQVLPAGIGIDAVRIWFLTQRGARVGPSVASVVLDRLAGLGSLLLLIAVFLPLLFSRVNDDSIETAITIVLAGGAGGFGLLFILLMVPRRLDHIKSMAAMANTIRFAQQNGLFRRPALESFGLSIIVHIASVVVVWFLAEGLGLAISWSTLLALIPTVMLLAMLPISLAGWGVRESAMVTALGYVGVDAGAALALSVLFGVVMIIASLPGALFWLLEGRGLAPLICSKLNVINKQDTSI